MTDWTFTNGIHPDCAPDCMIEARGRYGDVYGPLPRALFAGEAWSGNMLHGSHDLVAWRLASKIEPGND